MDKNFLEYLLLMDDEKQEKYIQKYLDCIRKEKEKGTKHIDLDEFDHMFCNTSGIKDEITQTSKTLILDVVFDFNKGHYV